MESYKLEQKLDIIISMLNNNIEVIRIAMCPYCNEMNDINFNEIMHDKQKRDVFFSSAELVNCDNCNRDFYKTDVDPVTVRRSHKSVPGVIMVGGYNKRLDICVNINKFTELKKKYFTGTGDLAKYLPNNDELRERYNDLQNSFANNDSNRQKLFNIRSVIESYLVYTNDVDTAHNLHKEVEKLDMAENIKELFKHIIKQCVNAIHVKKDLADINPEKAFKLIDIIFTQQYKIPEEKRKIEEKRKEIEKELQYLINNF